MEGGCSEQVEVWVDIALQVSVHTPQLLYQVKCLVPPHVCVARSLNAAALMSTSEMSERSLLPGK